MERERWKERKENKIKKIDNKRKRKDEERDSSGRGKEAEEEKRKRGRSQVNIARSSSVGSLEACGDGISLVMFPEEKKKTGKSVERKQAEERKRVCGNGQEQKTGQVGCG